VPEAETDDITEAITVERRDIETIHGVVSVRLALNVHSTRENPKTLEETGDVIG